MLRSASVSNEHAQIMHVQCNSDKVLQFTCSTGNGPNAIFSIADDDAKRQFARTVNKSLSPKSKPLAPSNPAATTGKNGPVGKK